jgi:DNA-directed RNA polymerase sigma subunit (sigma70/sigma32)
MSSYLWPNEDGWPYPDQEGERADIDGEMDDDVLMLKAPPPHLFDGLNPLERHVIASRFGIGGAPIVSMKQLHTDLDLPRADVRQALGSGLTKLRARLGT